MIDEIAHPNKEWVMVRWPKRHSKNAETGRNIFPMVDFGWSISGIIDPKTANKIIDQ